MNEWGPSSRPPFGRAAQSYRQTAVETAGPAQLIVEVHDAALTSVLQRVSQPGSEAALLRAHALVSELQSALQTEGGSPLARELDGFYDELLNCIVDAYVQGTTTTLPHVADALRELRGAWSSLCERTRAADSVGGVGGLTSGQGRAGCGSHPHARPRAAQRAP